MRRLIRTGSFPLGALLVAAGLVTACGRKEPARSTPEVAVLVVQPQQVILTSTLPGRVSAFQVAEVHPQVNGIVRTRRFTEGARVQAGEVLYEIDPGPYQAAFQTASATLARAEASLPAVRNRAQRLQQLSDAGAVGQQDCEDAAAALRQVEADILTGKAALESARINLAYTRITAPISGRAGRSSVTPGALASAYQGPPFTTIQQLDPVYVDSPQSSATLLEIRRNLATRRPKGGVAGQAKVRLILEDGTPYPQAGLVKFSDVTVDPSTGTQNLRMVFPNPAQVLLPGMYVRAVVEEGVLDEAILVPQQGVTRDPKGNAIAMVVDASGKVEQRLLQVQRAVGDRWLVRSGLGPGDRLVLEGLQKIRPGVAVKVVPFRAKPAPAK